MHCTTITPSPVSKAPATVLRRRYSVRTLAALIHSDILNGPS